MRRNMPAVILGLLGTTIAPVLVPAQAPESDVRERDALFAKVAQNIRAQPQQWRDATLGWLLEREATLRLLSILSGTPPSGDRSSGWLVPSRARHTIAWLNQQFDRDGDGAVSATEWTGRQDWFQRLDRDRDGSITAKDLDWSADSPLAKAGIGAKMLFREIDTNGDGQVSGAEWQDYMLKLSQGRTHLTQDDLLPLFASAGPKKFKARSPRDGGNINLAMFKAFFEGDVASIFEGPRPGSPAPDFTLPTVDGKTSLTLSKHFGKRPVVLVFGSFT